jgi:hypothetical protein
MRKPLQPKSKNYLPLGRRALGEALPSVYDWLLPVFVLLTLVALTFPAERGLV